MKEFVKVLQYPLTFWPSLDQPLWFWLHVTSMSLLPTSRDYTNLNEAIADAADYAQHKGLDLFVEEDPGYPLSQKAIQRVKESLLGPPNA